HTLVAQMRARVKRLAQNGDEDDSPEVKRQLVEKVEQLARAVARVTEFGFPLDLNLSNTDVRELLYEVLLRFHEDFSTRGISLEIEVASEVKHATVDRLKLREALGELVRNALHALPEQGGKLGLRARVAQDDLIIEVADNGRGTDEPLIDQTFSDGDGRRGAEPKRAGVGLKLVKAVAEQHGGRVTTTSEQGEGTHVQMRLPLRA
ncbi:MAG: ATP-binding protein, partial [Pyrinomonadaceae bacterium]|nr:ATP-binding protein [Pyrinomonadaceae bacterium]